jgi:hypothetical protein
MARESGDFAPGCRVSHFNRCAMGARESLAVAGNGNGERYTHVLFERNFVLLLAVKIPHTNGWRWM